MQLLSIKLVIRVRSLNPFPDRDRDTSVTRENNAAPTVSRVR